MAEKTEAEDVKSSTELKKENGFAKSPVKRTVNGSAEAPASPENVVEIVPVNGVQQSPGAGKQSVMQNGEESEATSEDGAEEEPEGSLWIYTTVWVQHKLGPAFNEVHTYWCLMVKVETLEQVANCTRM